MLGTRHELWKVCSRVHALIPLVAAAASGFAFMVRSFLSPRTQRRPSFGGVSQRSSRMCAALSGTVVGGKGLFSGVWASLGGGRAKSRYHAALRCRLGFKVKDWMY